MKEVRKKIRKREGEEANEAESAIFVHYKDKSGRTRRRKREGKGVKGQIT
jgi:hypothetical protein